MIKNLKGWGYQEKSTILKNFLSNDIITFGKTVFPKHFELEAPKFHKEIYSLITDDAYDRVAIASPRGSSKSTIITFLYVMYQALYEKSKVILIISDTYSQSVRFLNTIKKEIETNEVLQFLFGNLKAAKWAENHIELTTGVNIIALGQGDKIRGIKIGENRPDLIILDDLENYELVDSDERREKLTDWFYGEMLPAIDPHKYNKIIYIGTILHYDSMLNKILNNNRWKSKLYKAIKDDGSSLWAERYPLDKLKDIKDEYTRLAKIDKFYAEYMNDPVSSENAEFKKEWFQYYEPDDIDRKELNIFTAVDLAISKKETADYTAIVTCGVDSENNIYILEIVRKRLDPKEVIDELFRVDRKYHPQQIGIETVSYQQALIFFLNDEMKRRNHFLSVIELKADMDKERRIRRLIPRYKAKTVFHRYYMTELEEELLRFPKGAFDDVCDASSYTLELLYPSTVKKKEKHATIYQDPVFELSKKNIPREKHWLYL